MKCPKCKTELVDFITSDDIREIEPKVRCGLCGYANNYRKFKTKEEKYADMVNYFRQEMFIQ